jgi:biopolymer transport protein TolR
MKLGGDGYLSEINVTPFVDVMLVLLIIFMVTAPMMIQGLDVDLPQVSAKPLDTKEEQLIITIDKANQIFINDFQTNLDSLQTKLLKILEGRTDPEVFIKADKDIVYGTVVQVMAAIRGAGVEKVGMVTTPADIETQDGEAKAKS